MKSVAVWLVFVGFYLSFLVFCMFWSFFQFCLRVLFVDSLSFLGKLFLCFLFLPDFVSF